MPIPMSASCRRNKALLLKAGKGACVYVCVCVLLLIGLCRSVRPLSVCVFLYAFEVRLFARTRAMLARMLEPGAGLRH